MRKKIFLVDDEFDHLAALKAGLESAGYEVACAQDPRRVFKDVESVCPDLVITDLMMPYMSGYEVILGLRDASHCAKTPIILMSSIQPSAKQSHFKWDAFLRKPVDFPTLLKAVESLIGKSEPSAT